MNSKDVFEKIKNILVDIIEDKNHEVKYSSSSNDIPEWDSIVHIQLIVAIENEFDISFLSSEMSEYKTIGELSEAVYTKLQKKGV